MTQLNSRRMFVYTYIDSDRIIDPFFTLCEPCLDNIDVQNVVQKWFVTQNPTIAVSQVHWDKTNAKVFCLSCGHHNEFEEQVLKGPFQVVPVYDETRPNTPAGLLFFADERQVSNMWFPDRAIRDQYFDEDVRPDMTAFYRDLVYREAQMEYELDGDATPMSTAEVVNSLAVQGISVVSSFQHIKARMIGGNNELYYVVDTLLNERDNTFILRLMKRDEWEKAQPKQEDTVQ